MRIARGPETKPLDVVYFSAGCRLGSSAMAQAYAISSLGEALAYLFHPILVPRLQERTEAAVLVRIDRLAGYLARRMT